MRRLAHWLLVLALSFSIGLQWAVMQSAAWVGMVITYSQSETFGAALTKTFDGKHPCSLCKVAQSGESSQKKQNTLHRVLKFELSITENEPFISLTLVMQRMTAVGSETWKDLELSPPTPPPRMA